MRRKTMKPFLCLCFVRNKKNGFTLIELLVVVLVIGVLAAIAIPQYEKTVLRSRITGVLFDLPALQQAQEVYYIANGMYATNFDDLDWKPRLNCFYRSTSETMDNCLLRQGGGFYITTSRAASTIFPPDDNGENRIYCYRGLQAANGIYNYFDKNPGVTICYASVSDKRGDSVLKSMGNFIEHTTNCVCNGCTDGRGGCNGYRM